MASLLCRRIQRGFVTLSLLKVASCLQDREKGRLTEDPSRARESVVRPYPSAHTLHAGMAYWACTQGHQCQTHHPN